jgi:hypothetical protein
MEDTGFDSADAQDLGEEYDWKVLTSMKGFSRNLREIRRARLQVERAHRELEILREMKRSL